MISNPALIKKSTLRDHFNEQVFGKLWKLAARWPMSSGVPRLTYTLLACGDATKAEIYRDFPDLRDFVLQSCTGRDQKTLDSALQDDDEERSERAYKIAMHVLGAD
jgi:hypothetical protein